MKLFKFIWNDRVLEITGTSLEDLSRTVPTYYSLFSITKL